MDDHPSGTVDGGDELIVAVVDGDDSADAAAAAVEVSVAGEEREVTENCYQQSNDDSSIHCALDLHWRLVLD